MNTLQARRRQIVRTAGLVGITASILPLFVARMKTTRGPTRREVRDAWVRTWARSLLTVFAIDAVVEGNKPGPSGRGRVVVGNHRSAIDIGVLLSIFGGTMVSRADLATWPLIGAAARAAGTVFVDRKNANSRALTVRAMQNHLLAGDTIVLFPEGTTFDGDEVRPFHAGAFVAAARAEAEIVPVGLAYPRASGAAYLDESFPEHLARMAASNPTRMVARIGEPFVAKATDRAAALTARAHAEVQNLVLRARDRCGE